MLELRPPVNCPRPTLGTYIAALVFGLAACSSDAPSHLPNPLLLPGHALGNAVHNASYNARRSTVKSYITRNFSTLQREIVAGGGPVLTQGYVLARIVPARHPALSAMLTHEPNLSRDPEALTVTLMVHGP